jgi:hypothetical protein
VLHFGDGTTLLVDILNPVAINERGKSALSCEGQGGVRDLLDTPQVNGDLLAEVTNDNIELGVSVEDTLDDLFVLQNLSASAQVQP